MITTVVGSFPLEIKDPKSKKDKFLKIFGSFDPYKNLIEEIVGEIRDEYDEAEEEMIQKVNDQEYIVEGSMNLDDLNDNLGTELESEDYDSLGGFIIEHLDRLPEVGDHITTEDQIRLVVEKLDKNRIETVHVYLPPKADSGLEENDN